MIMSTPHENIQYKVNCEGTCNCYEEEIKNYNNNNNIDVERRISRLVYSFRYTGAVIVSVLGFATARFVDKHIDDCYQKAKSILGYNEQRGLLLTCAMTKNDCDADSILENLKDITEERRLYECIGHCYQRDIKSSRFSQKEAKKVIREIDCENILVNSEVIEVKKDDYLFSKSKQNPDKPMYKNAAIEKYRQLYLEPACKTVVTGFWYEFRKEPIVQWTNIFPCTGTRFSGLANNVKCRLMSHRGDLEWEEEEEEDDDDDERRVT